jgi:hypothetical protein
MSAKLFFRTSFSTVAGHTLKLLLDNNYVPGPSILPRAYITVTDKGLAALETQSPISGISLNDEIGEASKSIDTNEGRRRLAEVVGSFLRSAVSLFTKGIAGG